MKLKHMRLLIVLGLLLPLTGLGQKRQYKKGLALEKQGEITLAMNLYKEALYKNMFYSRAKVALERTANTRVESLLGDYFIARQKGNGEEAHKISKSVKTIRDEMKYFFIEIDLPDYQEARLKEDLAQIPDASSGPPIPHRNLELEAEASRAFEAGNYFSSYDLYSSLLAEDPGNKDYAYYLDQSKALGSMSIAVVDLEDSKTRHTRSLKAAILSELALWSHPLLTIVEREDLNALIQEQKRVFTGLFEESSTASPGMLKGVKNLLIISLEDVQYKKGAEKSVRQTAYESTRTKVFDEAGNWRTNPNYVPRHYQEKLERASSTGTLHYKLIEVETGRILTANQVKGIIEDERTVLTYHGDANTLYPQRNGEIVVRGGYVQEFRNSFSNQDVLKSENQLFNDLENQLVMDAVSHLKELLLGGGL